MKFKLTIGKKIGLGFGILIILIMVVFGATYFAVNKGVNTFEQSKEMNSVLVNVITPSKEKISALRLIIKDSKQYAIQWVSQQTKEEEPFKVQLKSIMQNKIPDAVKDIKLLSRNWSNIENSQLFYEVPPLIDSLLISYEVIMTHLPDFASYDDIFAMFYAGPLVDQNGPVSVLASLIDTKLRTLQINFENQEEKLLDDNSKSFNVATETFSKLNFYWVLGALSIILATLVAIFTTKSIVTPVRYLKKILLALGKGIIPNQSARVSNDEIGEMSDALNHLVSGLKKTTSFARDVGQSKFDSLYKPLSDKDELGHALLVMRDELKETERNLERKVEERTEEVVKQREKVQELYKDVRDSIVYAKRLQNSILPTQEKVKSICPQSFILYKPKDIVSGDFYWFEKINNKSIFSIVDCTGHGVPGAFMSLLGSNGLNSALKEGKLSQPAAMLDYLNKSIFESLNKSDITNEVRDGMDVALCAIDHDTLELEYSGANNPLYIIRDGEFIIIKANKIAIGSFAPGEANFDNHKVQLQKGDSVYIFSDGYPDQFGGPKGRKLMYNRFREYLLEISNNPIELQGELLNTRLMAWQGKMDQIDDILVIGLKI
ncbi:hypothetical protein DNU06_13335 [Putridiphycobacter roseus]|uniref:HAMP domain-containing protein n=1 Tax=Putridiphycobacter roseus TaxID=2219161 RepID=A0A2W1N061_9FLAO|nr:SpoIIE family protein phosphatase [Putridiphycobacter roseus]PZE16291.1 hypothetical protein DNU06_13335 [Putridiphycobacter roseus]